ncbi:MAG: B12-binding domain-containing radical SAM protein [Lachnospiraceae bacterium]|nr:B12-binding domain-containing radical SAM protein [Lachnospiraceae bacterium]
MSEILLVGVNAKYIHSNPAIYSLKAYAKAHCQSAEVEIVEYTINQSRDSILADLYKRKPLVAAFSCYIWNWSMIQDVLAELPKLLPDTNIWLGGPEVSFHAKELLAQYPMVTGIMLGEGEETFTELVQHYNAHDRELSDIKGIITVDGYTGDRVPVEMDDIPFLYEDLSLFENRIIYYESQRGCPFRCAYCLSSIDKSVRLRSMELVERELQFFLDNQVKQVKFIDRTFNCNAKHAVAIWRYIVEHDNGITNFHFEIAADLITKEQLELIGKMRPGLIQLEIGVQSTNNDTLQAINRYTDYEQLREIVDKIRSYGNVHQHLDLIAGLPYEDYQSFAKSFDEVYSMRPQQLQLGFLKVLKGSPIEEKAGEYGIIYSSKAPYEVLYSNWISYSEIQRLKGIEEMVELYYNSGQFAHILPVLEQEFDSAFSMYEAMAQYYEEKDYFIQVPARGYRYQVLLEFAVAINPKREQLYRELLTFDMYLRENLKSRPMFAANQEPYKEQIKEFYRQEATEWHYLKGYEQYNSVQLQKMTHMELFEYPVWEENPVERLEKQAYVLFDYKHRNPITNDADIFVIC